MQLVEVSRSVHSISVSIYLCSSISCSSPALIMTSSADDEIGKRPSVDIERNQAWAAFAVLPLEGRIDFKGVTQLVTYTKAGKGKMKLSPDPELAKPYMSTVVKTLRSVELRRNQSE